MKLCFLEKFHIFDFMIYQSMIRYTFFFLFAVSVGNVYCQPTTTGASGNVITTAMPFLTIASDAKAASMADLGAATKPDPNSAFWNPGKLAFNEEKLGIATSYTPWLRQLGIDDMWISYVSAYFKPKDKEDEAFGAYLNYFNLGEIQFTDIAGETAGSGRPKEWSVGLTYSRKLSENLGLGLSLKFLRSNLAQGLNSSNGGDDLKPANTVAADIGMYKKQEIYLARRIFDVAFGASITNLGGKVTYSSSENQAFIPTNLRLGTFWQTEIDEYHKIGFGLDFNKLLVPTPDPDDESIQDKTVLSGVFSSFADAPDGFSEELQEITVSLGAEYWYQDAFAVRAGYFHESAEKGNRKNFTVGVGLKYQDFGLDVAYLIPIQQNNPLASTIRFTLAYLLK